MDINKAAQLLGVHYQTVRNMILDGRLQAEKVGGAWDISEEQINAVLDKTVKRMDEANELFASVNALQKVQEATQKVSADYIVEASRKLLQAVDQGADIRNAIGKLEECIKDYRNTETVAAFLNDSWHKAKRIDEEATAALKQKVDMQRNKFQNSKGDV